MRQFIDVVISYERINVKTFGVVGDGGGGNQKFFKLLTSHLPMIRP